MSHQHTHTHICKHEHDFGEIHQFMKNSSERLDEIWGFLNNGLTDDVTTLKQGHSSTSTHIRIFYGLGVLIIGGLIGIWLK